MKRDKLHKEHLPENIKVLEKRLSMPYVKSKANVWEELENKLSSKQIPVQKSIFQQKMMIAIAASLLALIALGTIIRFYTVSYVCPAGKTMSVKLPDNSTVILNSDSKISYYPLWWNISRNLYLSGEAWFGVKKGNRFTVNSKKGKTTVLGTTFNIYARLDAYRVVCITGKVKVESKISKNQIVLNPSDEAEIVDANGNIIYHRNINLEPVVAWKSGLFIFTATPLKHVIDELERRYNMSIELKKYNNALYTGSFPDTVDIYSALNLVCKPFGLKFAINKNGTIVIFK